MACQVCGSKSGYYPLCKECFRLRDEGAITKCETCGIWKGGSESLCEDCNLQFKKKDDKNSRVHPSELEKEDKGFRDKFPAIYRCEDGHCVRSKAEMIIDDWLYHKRIIHAVERRVPIPDQEMFCDFFLPEPKAYIEYWGRDDNAYLKRKDLKKKAYIDSNKILIELVDKDVERLDDVFPVKLMKHLPKGFSFD